MSRVTTIPLCVDLDGTLIQTDSLYECLAWMVKHRPASLLLVPLWLLDGRAKLKSKLAELVKLRADLLPYHPRFLGWLKTQKEEGRELVLATAADGAIAGSVAETLGLFDRVIASDAGHNLKGHDKLAALQALFPEGFDYAGNSSADLAIWRGAREAIVVNPGRGVERQARATANVTRVFERDPASVSDWLRALRLHQWVKNLLVFVPLLTSHRLAELQLLAADVVGFLAFGFCASGTYLLNDLMDLEVDRQHARKRSRPLAAGKISIPAGMAAATGLLLLAAGSALLLPLGFRVAMAVYFVVTIAYSVSLKRRLLLDVLTLSALYVIRILAGGAAIHVPISDWLLGFSVFIFLSLAFCKRAIELRRWITLKSGASPGRAYRAEDLQPISSCGIASGFVASLVLTLYIDSSQMRELYANSHILWLLPPLVLYWITRIWIFEHRGLIDDDPIVFAVSDRVTYLVVLAGAGILAAGLIDWERALGALWPN